ncbi:MAG: cation transporter [Lentisphaeria bacterium]|nr:cation transporter [Lentisphaeria bacterium]
MFFDWPLRIFAAKNGVGDAAELRRSQGICAGWTGVLVNAFLAILKFAVAVYTGSVAIAVDAVNNLSDAGSGVVTAIGFKIAGMPADDEHPFGHGRVEYIAGLIVAVIVIAVGLNFLKESVVRIFNPSPVRMDWIAGGFLLLAIFCKFWLFGFFRTVGEKTASPAIKAAALDSLSDLTVTFLVLISMFAGKFTSFPVDGVAGCLVAVCVIIAGVKVLKEIADPLIGIRPDQHIVQELTRRLLDCPGICGVHDCIIHNYGPGLSFATAHAEVDSRSDVISVHDMLENAEVEVAKSMSMVLVLHCDPFNVDDPTVISWRRRLENAVSRIDDRFKIYDFRFSLEDGSPSIRFHLLVSRNDMEKQEEITRQLEKVLHRVDSRAVLEISFINAYV